MKYLVIERFPRPTILCDDEGNPLIYEDYDEALGNALSECQDGIVVNITTGCNG